jgi:hypothetical protein
VPGGLAHSEQMYSEVPMLGRNLTTNRWQMFGAKGAAPALGAQKFLKKVESKHVFGKVTWLVKQTISGFVEDGALSLGAAIAYYTIFSIAPILIIVIAIAGLVFGQDAAEGAIVGQLSGLMGQQSAEALQNHDK